VLTKGIPTKHSVIDLIVMHNRGGTPVSQVNLALAGAWSRACSPNRFTIARYPANAAASSAKITSELCSLPISLNVALAPLVDAPTLREPRLVKKNGNTVEA
jgi:hypothetical protein